MAVFRLMMKSGDTEICGSIDSYGRLSLIFAHASIGLVNGKLRLACASIGHPFSKTSVDLLSKICWSQWRLLPAFLDMLKSQSLWPAVPDMFKSKMSVACCPGHIGSRRPLWPCCPGHVEVKDLCGPAVLDMLKSKTSVTSVPDIFKSERLWLAVLDMLKSEIYGDLQFWSCGSQGRLWPAVLDMLKTKVYVDLLSLTCGSQGRLWI